MAPVEDGGAEVIDTLGLLVLVAAGAGAAKTTGTAAASSAASARGNVAATRRGLCGRRSRPSRARRAEMRSGAHVHDVRLLSIY